MLPLLILQSHEEALSVSRGNHYIFSLQCFIKVVDPYVARNALALADNNVDRQMEVY